MFGLGGVVVRFALSLRVVELVVLANSVPVNLAVK